jgi:uncharacterized protein (DUF302 family)
MLSCRPLLADDSFFAESCDMPFPEAMTVLQEAVASQGYTVSRVQHVDKGLRLRGYETGLYRVVFFGRPQQMAAVRRNYPVLMSYLPLKITLFEDEGRVVASTLQPATLSSFFDDEEIRQLLNTWQKDMTKIMLYYRSCGEAAGFL